MRTTTLLGLALSIMIATASPASAQAQRPMHAGEIAQGLRKLGVVGNVLYVAAHPDDENTRLLAWLVGEKRVRAGYLSLTRGDGGQNLIGTEQSELLGLIRTHELLAARRIDGAEQLFTRARDFGYSKSAQESLQIWGHEAVLEDVVLAIRRFKPDVILTRFNERPPNHGHHTASAILAREAFEAAADPSRFPEQVARYGTWKVDRLLYNVSTWRLGPDADMSGYLKVDVGGYDPLVGRSWGEIAADSRSQHKSQGFGVAAQRGTSHEYFSPVAGTRPKAEPFEGLDLSWGRFAKGEPKHARAAAAVAKATKAAWDGFDAKAPHASIPALLKVRAALRALPDDNPFKASKLADTEALIAACAGLHLEARAAEPAAVPGGSVQLRVSALNRSPAALRLVSVTLPGGDVLEVNAALGHNVPVGQSPTVAVPAEAPVSTPYWLRDPQQGGLFSVADRALVGRPSGDPALAVAFTWEVGGERFVTTRPVVYAWVDPVRGELYRDLEIVPAVTANLDRPVVMFPNGQTRDVSVTLAAGRDAAEGVVRLELPDGWRAEPAERPFELASKGAEASVAFRVTPPKGASERASVRAVVELNGRKDSWAMRGIAYDHIPPLTVRKAAQADLVPLQLETRSRRIGYIPGPGDTVAEDLAAVGFEVTLLPDERLAKEPLERFDAILVGVRAYNTNPRLASHHERLMKYVEQGGRLVVQYMTNNHIAPLKAPLGPWPIEIGRDRVTDEAAAMTPVDPKDGLLAGPNALGPADFDGWVQERGLYFATTWDARYRPVFELQDAGDEPSRGALLVARHGKGTFVYTGLSFFRQLPAGVPGAYRLLANLLSQ